MNDRQPLSHGIEGGKNDLRNVLSHDKRQEEILRRAQVMKFLEEAEKESETGCCVSSPRIS